MGVLPFFGLAFGLVDVSERAGYVRQPWGGGLTLTVEGVLFYFILVRNRFIPEELLTMEGLAYSFVQLSGFFWKSVFSVCSLATLL